MNTQQIEKIADEICKELFTDGEGNSIRSLRLEDSNGHHRVGAWGISGVRRVVIDSLSANLASLAIDVNESAPWCKKCAGFHEASEPCY